MSEHSTETAVAGTASRIRGNPSATPLPDGDEMLNRPELARRLAVSERHVDYLVRTKKVPFLRLGTKCIRFRWRSVVAALE